MSDFAEARREQFRLRGCSQRFDAIGMASPKLLRGRYSYSGCYYSITTVISGRRPLLSGDNAARAVQCEISRAETEGYVRNLVWMLMPDHLHWIFQLRKAPIGKCMQRFKSKSARTINGIAGTTGSVWQAGYYDRQIRSQEELATQVRYVLGNPLRKGLVERIEDHPWWWSAWTFDSDEPPW